MIPYSGCAPWQSERSPDPAEGRLSHTTPRGTTWPVAAHSLPVDGQQKRCIMFTDRIVLVTGGTSGIGYALAQQFRDAGARVVDCSRSQKRLDATGNSLPGITGLRCDVTEPDQLRHLVGEVGARFGKLDILVNNAGVLSERDFTDPVDLDDVEAEIQVNLVSPIKLTSLAMPLLRKADRASIVMVISGYALAPSTRAPVYSAAKAGLRAFSKALRRQVGPLGITVVEVIPPLVDTPAVAHREGKKISPQAVAAATLSALASGRSEVLIGRVRSLPLLMRMAPGLAETIVARS
jgi:uncharacterized oxidoreductase